MNNPNPEVDWFFTKPTKWQEAYEALRERVLASGLSEDLKWGCPCYMFQDTNVVLIHGFKNYCALLFMKGVLMQDAHGILIQQTKNVQSARQIRFANLAEIMKMELVIKAYIQEAIAVEKAGLTVEMKPVAEFEMPEEFERILEDMPELKSAFYNLTPGRRRGYLLYFSAPKQAKTREARIEKYIPAILDGKGVNDKYSEKKQ